MSCINCGIMGGTLCLVWAAILGSLLSLGTRIWPLVTYIALVEWAWVALGVDFAMVGMSLGEVSFLF